MILQHIYYKKPAYQLVIPFLPLRNILLSIDIRHLIVFQKISNSEANFKSFYTSKSIICISPRIDTLIFFGAMIIIDIVLISKYYRF